MLLTKPQAAQFLGFSIRHLESLMHNGTGPRFLKLGKRLVRFRQCDLDSWVADQPSFASVSAASRAAV
jgi:predicted DNA-binding transcriptional regulator AlpA